MSKESRITGWQMRQRDTGWGRAIAQAWVPLYWIYYAITRKTITPAIYGLGTTFGVALLVGLISPTSNKDALESQAQLLGIAVAPFAFKVGSDRAREYGRLKLLEAGKDIV